MSARVVLTRLAWTAAAALALAQLIRPARTNPRVAPQKALVAIARPPADVAATLNRACGDCHSNRTVWPWYTNVAPISWWIVDHVNEGRRRVSFSDWADYDRVRQLKELDQTCTRVTRRNMPLTSYLLMHRESRLSDADRRAICDWTAAEREVIGRAP